MRAVPGSWSGIRLRAHPRLRRFGCPGSGIRSDPAPRITHPGNGFVARAVQYRIKLMTTTARLGLDTYSLRAQNWDAFQQLDYCAARGVAGRALQRAAADWRARRAAPRSRARACRFARPRHRDRDAVDLPDLRHLRSVAGIGRRTTRTRDRCCRHLRLAARPLRRLEIRSIDGARAASNATSSRCCRCFGRRARERWMRASRSRSRTTRATCRRAS